jgi:hypothetical protein
MKTTSEIDGYSSESCTITLSEHRHMQVSNVPDSNLVKIRIMVCNEEECYIIVSPVELHKAINNATNT